MLKLTLNSLRLNNVILFKLEINDTCTEVLKQNGNRVAGLIPYIADMDIWIEYLGWISDTLTEEK